MMEKLQDLKQTNLCCGRRV